MTAHVRGGLSLVCPWDYIVSSPKDAVDRKTKGNSMSLASAKDYVGVNLLDFYSKTKQGWWETKIRGKKQNNGGRRMWSTLISLVAKKNKRKETEQWGRRIWSRLI
jgi:hypothetical protein